MINSLNDNTDNALCITENESILKFAAKAPFGFASLTAKGHFAFANPSLIRLFETNLKELQGKYFSDFVSPLDHQKINELFERERETPMEFQLQSSSGQTHMAAVHVQPVFSSPDSSQREIRFFNLIVNDLSDREDALKRLKKLDNRLRALNEAETVGTHYFNLDGKYVEPNEALLKMVGYSREEFNRGEVDLQRLTPSEWHEQDALIIKKLRSGEARSATFMKEWIDKSGKTFPISKTVVLLDDDQYYGFSIVQDMSALFEARSLAEDSRLKADLALEAAQTGVWEVELDGKSILWDTRCREIFGFKENELDDAVAVQKRISVEDLERVCQTLDEAFKSPGPPSRSLEFKIQTNSGERIVVATGQSFESRWGSERRLVGTLVDVTEVRQAAKEYSSHLLQAKEAAENAARAKSNFLANMSHEIRTPLGAIIGFTDLLNEENLEARDRGEFLQIIGRNCQSLSRIVDDILDLSKVEAGLLTLEKSEFSPTLHLRNTMALFAELARSKGLRLKLKAPQDMPLMISDPMRIHQIVANLISNAIKFTKSGDIWIEAQYQEGQLTIDVCDTGIGISDEQMSKLFQPFSQADESMSRRVGGTGLGLHLSRRLAEALGGNLEIKKSAPGLGTCFTLRIPVDSLGDKPKVSDFIQIQTRETTLDNSDKSLMGRRFLVIDDSKDNQLLIDRILKRHGAIVDFANDGQSGIESAMRHEDGEYDLILMDLQMPGLDGFQATERLRAQGLRTPIVALTAHVIEEVRKRCLEVGCSAFLSKPIHANDLIRTVKGLWQH